MAERTIDGLQVCYAHEYPNPQGRSRTAAEQVVRDTSYALKAAEPQAVARAAREMAPLVRSGCDAVLVPVPDSQGRTAVNMALAEAIARLVGARVCDALRRAAPVESSLVRRQRGGQSLTVDAHGMLAESNCGGRAIYLVDNVVHTGNTLRAAQRALGSGAGLVYSAVASGSEVMSENKQSWNSPQGLRQVVREEGGRFYVQTGTRRTLDLFTADQVREEQHRDAANLAHQHRIQADAQAEAQAAAQEAEQLQTALAGFTEGMTPMRRAKVVSALTALRRFSGVPRRIIDQVRDRVAAGAVVQTHPEDGRRLVDPDGSFLVEKDLSKTAFDYAAHLIRQKETATDQKEPAAQPLVEDINALAGGECSLPLMNACAAGLPVVRVGLPYPHKGRLFDEVQKLGAPTLISMGSMFRGPKGAVTSTGFPTFEGFTPVGGAAWATESSLDSAGFTAMLAGGYRWTPEDYVDFVVTNRGDGEAAFPWKWWSAMDYCVEPKIAPDRAEVERRMRLTVETYGQILDHLQHWRHEGVTDVPDPMPILQGRTPADYLWSASAMAKVIDHHHECSCPYNGDCEAAWHRTHAGLPALVGLGSVCRRELHGPEGLLEVLAALDKALPKHVKLHLFGVKGNTLDHLRPYLHRVHSIDSMAWDEAATRSVQKQRKAGGTVALKPGDPGFVSNTTENRAQHMADWYQKQQARVSELNRVVYFADPEGDHSALTARGQIVHTATPQGAQPADDVPADHVFHFPGGRQIGLFRTRNGWVVRNTNPTSGQDTETPAETYAAGVHALGLATSLAVPAVHANAVAEYEARMAQALRFDADVMAGHVGERLQRLRAHPQWDVALRAIVDVGAYPLAGHPFRERAPQSRKALRPAPGGHQYAGGRHVVYTAEQGSTRRQQGGVILPDVAAKALGRVPLGPIVVPTHSGVQSTALADIEGVPADVLDPAKVGPLEAPALAGELPPLTLQVHANGSVKLLDGNHRLAAARAVGAERVDVDWILQGGGGPGSRATVVDTEPTPGETRSMSPAPTPVLSPAQQSALRRFVTKGVAKASAAELVLRALQIPTNLHAQNDSRDYWLTTGSVTTVGRVGDFNVVDYISHQGRPKVPAEGLFKVETLWPTGLETVGALEALRKTAGQRARKQIAAWKEQAAKLLQAADSIGGQPALDPRDADALLKYAKGVELNRKQYAVVYQLLRVTPAEQEVLGHDWRSTELRSLKVDLRRRAYALLGVESPEEVGTRKDWEVREGFLPPEKATHGWTCTGCFNAQAIDRHGRMVHHGYLRPGVGHIVGDCIGVGEVPWETGPGVVARVLDAQQRRSDEALKHLQEGWKQLAVDSDRPWVDPATGKQRLSKYSERPLWETDLITPSDPRWAAAEQRQIEATKKLLRHLWSTGFMAIPWLRAAVRDWRPSEVHPVGEPRPTISSADYAGAPPKHIYESIRQTP